jgi:hypothetical protein
MNRPRKLLIVLFFLVLALRLSFALATPHFDAGDSYFHLRQAQSVQETGFLLTDDPLSFGGRSHVLLPIFEYILGMLTLISASPVFLKTVLNACATSTVLVVFLLAKKLVKNEWYALFGAGVSGFIPLYFAQMNTISPLSIFVPLLFVFVYAFVSLPERKWIITYLALLVVLALFDTLLLVFIISLGVYLLIVYFEKLRQSRSEIEVTVFSIFFTIWVFFLIYKDPLLLHGPAIIWGNSPAVILAQYFSDVTIGQLVYGMGFIPFLFGLWTIYVYFFQQRSKVVYLLTAMVITLSGLLWLRLLDVVAGLIILGVVFSVLFSRGCQLFYEYVRQTKAARFRAILSVTLFILVLLTSGVSSVASAIVEQQHVLTDQEYEAIQFLEENTPANSTILAGITEGYAINALAHRATFIDGRYLLIEDAAKRYDNYRRLFTTSLEIDAVTLLDAHAITYIYFSQDTRREFSVDQLRYATNEDCFDTVFSNDAVDIIKKNPACKVRVIETT